jgi:1-acyl-sn-glycerol-3-phosphate acyltransferase
MEVGKPDITADQISENFVDLEKVIREKKPGLAKLLPGFLIRFLKRIIHEKDVNDIIYRNRDKFGLEFVDRLIAEFKTTNVVIGLENIPKEGRYILVANHPLGGLDGVALMSVAGKVRKDIIFPVNDLLMNLPNLKQLFAPINKHGSNKENLKIIEDIFASDLFILYFPAGLVSRKQGGRIIDLEWKKSIIGWAKKHRRDIIPAYIDGSNTNFFYNLAKYRKLLGIKQNIEMLFLVDEMFKQKDKKLTFYIGKPISYTTFDNSHTNIEWAQILKDKVYSLKQKMEKQ